jgi:polyphosphate kinase
MGKLKNAEYKDALKELQLELIAMARWAAATGARIVVLFEGRDTAGKSGVIRAIRQRLNPRQCRTVALGKPSEREATQWYFQRYVGHLPAAGEIVLFDRSWYNRAGVERVMGFASEEQVTTFLRQTPLFEKLLVEDGFHLFKYWLCCGQDEQEERFAERLEDPLKRWKLSEVDIVAREKYADYTAAREAMLAATQTSFAPWTLVDFGNQKRGRLTLIRDFLDRLPDTRVVAPELSLPLLGHEPYREEFAIVNPIPSFGD